MDHSMDHSFNRFSFVRFVLYVQSFVFSFIRTVVVVWDMVMWVAARGNVGGGVRGHSRDGEGGGGGVEDVVIRLIIRSIIRFFIRSLLLISNSNCFCIYRGGDE